VFGVTIAAFADAMLSRILNRVVIDNTGKAGLSDVHYAFTPTT